MRPAFVLEYRHVACVPNGDALRWPETASCKPAGHTRLEVYVPERSHILLIGEFG